MTDANACLRQRLRGICDHRIGEMIDAMIGELEWEARTRQPTLTDEERQAIERAAAWMARVAESRGDIHSAWYLVSDAATLRGLLERTK
jgi:hypothetical protein